MGATILVLAVAAALAVASTAITLVSCLREALAVERFVKALQGICGPRDSGRSLPRQERS
jgi:hypothetical protein